ncbi:MAG TPA: CBS domain-containing protein [Longimicrobium sp.]
MMTTAGRALRGRSVRDVLRTEMVTVVPEMTVYELAQTLLEASLRSAPVLSPMGRLVGVATLAEVTRLALREGLRPCAGPDNPHEPDGIGARPAGEPARCPPGVECLRVRDIMGPVGLTVSPDEPLSGLIHRFVQARVQRALVVENDMLLGLVTAVDVLNVIDGSL